MTMSDKQKSLNEKLITIQQTLEVPKTKYNSYGKYSYRTVEMILEQLKPLLDQEKVLLVFEDLIINRNEYIYIESEAILIDTESDSKINTVGFAREGETQKGMSPSQITTSATTYARKNALTAMFLLDDSEDEEDGFNVATEEDFQQIVLKINKAQVELQSLGIDFRDDEKTKNWIFARTGLQSQDLGEIAKSPKDIAKCRMLLNAYDILIQGKKMNEKG